VAEAPGHAGKFRSADGQWWELAESWVRPEHFGARGDGAADDTDAIAGWLRFLAGRAIGFVPPQSQKGIQTRVRHVCTIGAATSRLVS
jgi:hypothetical protein